MTNFEDIPHVVARVQKEQRKEKWPGETACSTKGKRKPPVASSSRVGLYRPPVFLGCE